MTLTDRRRPSLSLPVCSLFLASCATLTMSPAEPQRGEPRASGPDPAATVADYDAFDSVVTVDADGRLVWKDPFTDAPDDVVGLPGEYEPVDRVLLGWHGGNWDYVEFFADLLREILPDATALIAIENEEDQILLMDTFIAEGVDIDRIEFVIHELDSMWIRDYGPMVVRTRDGGHRVIDLPYHSDREQDDSYPLVFAQREELPISRPALEMEGGHIQADGTGRCIVTDDVLFRNRGFLYDEGDVRRILREFLGCEDVTFVPPLFGEETAHVDVFAYVTGPSRVIVGRYDRREDRANARRLDRAARALEANGWHVTRIPMPSNSRRTTFRTYTNVLVTDRTVLVPTFRRDRRFESHALRAFQDAFPDRRVVGIRADGVMDLAGALHCTAVTVPTMPRRGRGAPTPTRWRESPSGLTPARPRT